jgi:uncharacterized protein (TIGR00297 family)
MMEEIGVERGTGWKKAIPEGRDRLQSRVLVEVVGTLLLWMSLVTLQRDYAWVSLWSHSSGDPAPWRVVFAVGISIVFAFLVLALHAATLAGAIFGGLICLLLISGTQSLRLPLIQSALAPLAFLFVLTFLSTRAGRRTKAKAGLAEKSKGRSASQVIANLSIAGLSVTYLGLGLVLGGFGPFITSRSTYEIPMMTMCLAALVEATADTVSSEIGQAFGGVPVMLLSLRRVEPGTDGAVTVLGSLAGIVGGALVAAVGMWALRLSLPEAGIALAAGVLGLFFDSLLGATVERKGWLGNDLVNFASTLFAAGMALVLLRVLPFGI